MILNPLVISSFVTYMEVGILLSFLLCVTSQKLCIIDFLCIFASLLFLGVLAHLARALDWQSKGGEFESRMLHFFNDKMKVCEAGLF